VSELDLDLDLDRDRSEAPTSRLAIGSAVSAFLCIPGISGLLGLGLGVMALRQISVARLGGARLAWAGILGGLLNLLAWGPAAAHVLKVSNALQPPSDRFMRAWMESEKAGEEEAAPGLRPLLHHGEGELMRHALQEQFGDYRGLGAPSNFSYHLRLGGEDASARFPLHFASGAPISARLEFVRVHGEMRVVGLALESPLLTGLRGRTALHGEATPDVHDFGGADAHAPRELKTFRP
jgi:hypothetical protein